MPSATSSPGPPPRLPSLAELDAELARRSLAEFVRQAWPTLNPGRPLQWAWYLDAVCQHLEAVTRRQVRRLIDNQPPNTLKSTIVGVCWPAWVWATDPGHRWLFAANEKTLATRDAMAMRGLLASPWYRAAFRPAWRLVADQDEKSWFANTAGGHRISTSVGAVVTGKKGDTLVVDDPHSARRVHSAAQRRAVHEWYDVEFSNRVIDEQHSAIVLAGQRTHRDDLFRHVQKAGTWCVFRLPERFVPETRCETPIGYADPRTAPGEPLRPDRFGPDQEAEARAKGDSYWLPQHQQEDGRAAGAMFDRGKVRLVPAIPVGTRCVRYWDQAASLKDTACRTAGVLVGRTPDGFTVIADSVVGRWSGPDRVQLMKTTAAADRHRPGVRLAGTWVEHEGGSAGVDQAQGVVRELAGFSVTLDRPTGEKALRAEPLASQWAAGNVLLVEGPWNAGFLQEADDFPGGDLIDQIDAAAGGYNALAAGAGPTELPLTGQPGQALAPLPAGTFD